MRVRSDLFVSSLVRRVFSAGGFAAVTKKGVDEAGAIYIRQRCRDGSETLFGPAPQALVIDEDRDSRHFEIRLARGEPQAVDTLLEREGRFDSDFWVLEIELDEIGELLPMAGG